MTYNLNYPNNLVPIGDDRWQKENNIYKAHIANPDFIWRWHDDKGRCCSSDQTKGDFGT